MTSVVQESINEMHIGFALLGHQSLFQGLILCDKIILKMKRKNEIMLFLISGTGIINLAELNIGVVTD